MDLFNRQKLREQARTIDNLEAIITGEKETNESHHADNALLAGSVNTLERELIDARAAIIPKVSERRNLAYILAKHEAKAVFRVGVYGGDPTVELTFKPQLLHTGRAQGDLIPYFVDWDIVKALAADLGYTWSGGIVCSHNHLDESVGKNIEAMNAKLQKELDNYLKLTRYQAIADKEKADDKGGKTKEHPSQKL